MVNNIGGNNPISQTNIQSNESTIIDRPLDKQVDSVAKDSGVFSAQSDSEASSSLSGHDVSKQEGDAIVDNHEGALFVKHESEFPQDYDSLSELTGDEIVENWDKIKNPESREQLVKDKLVPLFTGPDFSHNKHEKIAKDVVKEYKKEISYEDKQLIWGKVQREAKDIPYAKSPQDLIFEWPEIASENTDKYLDELVEEKLAPYFAGEIKTIECDYENDCTAATALLNAFPKAFTDEQAATIRGKLSETLSTLKEKDVSGETEGVRVEHDETIQILENFLNSKNNL